MDDIKSQIEESINVKSELLNNCSEIIKQIAETVVNSYKNGNSLYLMGNGGSAADAQHIAGELVGRFKKERKALPALAFTTDTSVITAIANDYDYDKCFSRQAEAFVKKDDAVIGISTSGNSKNIIKAMEIAKERGAHTIVFTGRDGGALKDCVDLCLQVPSSNTPRIQEAHITVAHILCSIIERDLFA